ncbi:AHH domain-containing protein [Flavobacterium cerinum]|uniref:Uncharacterized protein n=1 Tax=Flavobacterium cerinum TaxID=2502784 RepID=A0A3S3RIL3_9FLAO|nr:AHH domain-containing protein [Flavobacterium cerinum]RWW98776.1 hypothetical protein EPI11_12675 [Flavobacterium cerinum]
MKQKLRMIIRITVICFFTFFLSCQNEDINLHEINENKAPHPEWVNARDLFSRLNTPEIRNSLTEITLRKELQKSSITEYDEKYFEKIVTTNYTNYSLYVSEYSEEQPYHLFFVVTIDNKNVENALFVKYSPKDGTAPFNIKMFTGLMEVYDIDYNIQGTAQFVSGKVTDGIMVTEECTTTTFISEVPCSNGGGHMIGDTCDIGYVNNAHYQISSVTECHNVYTFVGGTGGGGGAGGGSGISYNQVFLNSLTAPQKAIMDKYPEVSEAIFKHIQYYANGLEFPREMLTILAESEINEPLKSEGINALKMALATKTGGYFTKPFDTNYHQLIDPFTDVNLNSAHIEPWIMYFSVQCAVLRLEHPEWSTAKVYWHASKEMIHIGLDLVGLVPVVGEVADLANGVIYTIEGDGLNASLSYASAIPVAGWAAVGVKYAKKTIDITSSSKTTLKWMVKTGDIITFGDRTQLRKVLNLANGDPRQAHHIIPWAKSTHPAIQKAAKSGNEFHMNEVINGIPLNTIVHSGSHAAYDLKVIQKLNAIPANATPEQAYNAVLNIVQNIRAAIILNPNTHINNIIF